MENAITVKDVTKIYKLYDKPIDRLKEALNPFHKEYHKKFYALNNLSFEVKKGETVGIIGTNGSGKSTILKIITGVLTPTTGEVEVNGVISALLELGAGFTMDSTGMFVRLAFALAINVEPEILIVDEALSVGDVFFQSKCYRRMEEIRQKGTTILMVTHDMGSIIKYCDKVVLLNKGNFVAEGAPGHMVDLYKKILAGQMEGLEAAKDVDSDFSGENAEKEQKEKTYQLPHGKLMKDSLTINSNRTEYGDGRAEIYDLGLFDQRGNLTNLLLKGEEFTIKEKIRFAAPIQSPIFTYTIKDKKGTDLTGTNTMFEGTDIKPVKAGDEYEVSFTQKMTLQGGEYLLSMSCTGFEQGEHTVYHRLYDVANITVISNKNTVGVYDMESAVQAVKIERNHD